MAPVSIERLVVEAVVRKDTGGTALETPRLVIARVLSQRVLSPGHL